MFHGNLADVLRDAKDHAIEIGELAVVLGDLVDDHAIHDLETGKMNAPRLVQRQARRAIVEPTAQAAQRGVLAVLVTPVNNILPLINSVFQHSPGLGGRVLAVVVQHGRVATLCVAQPCQHGGVLAVIPRQMHVTDGIGVLFHQQPAGPFGKIGRSVVHQDNLKVSALEIGVGLIDEPADRRTCIENRYDKRDLRRNFFYCGRTQSERATHDDSPCVII